MTNIDAMPPTRPESHLVTVFGGSGFLGRHVVRALAKRGYRIRVAVRRPDLALFLQPLGRVNQIVAVQANVRYPDSVRRAVENADVVVNLVGILQEAGTQSFSHVQTEGAGEIARAAAAVGARVVHVSAIGADANSESLYGKSKALGEAEVLKASSDAVIVRPSLQFGPGDSFFNRFAKLTNLLPVLPLAGAETRMQPVFVGDVAEAIARAVDGHVAGGRVYELGGPEIATLERLIHYLLSVTQRRRLVLPVSWSVARLQARALEFADKATLGLLLPNDFKLTRDQVTMLMTDNVVSEEAKAEGRTIEGLGITPTTIEAIAPGYLWTYRKAGQFAGDHGTPSMEAVPDTLLPDHESGAAKPAWSGPSKGPDTTRPSQMGRRWGKRG